MSESPEETSRPLAIGIVRGEPSASDLAAVTAVLEAAVEEAADENARLAVTGPSAWQRSQRSVRTPVHPAHGAWRSFAG